jgi:hypothetical protein
LHFFPISSISFESKQLREREKQKENPKKKRNKEKGKEVAALEFLPPIYEPNDYWQDEGRLSCI